MAVVVKVPVQARAPGEGSTPQLWVDLDVEVCPHCKEHTRSQPNVECGTCGHYTHLSCVGLTIVPKGAWHCEACVARSNGCPAVYAGAQQARDASEVHRPATASRPATAAGVAAAAVPAGANTHAHHHTGGSGTTGQPAAGAGPEAPMAAGHGAAPGVGLSGWMRNRWLTQYNDQPSMRALAKRLLRSPKCKLFARAKDCPNAPVYMVHIQYDEQQQAARRRAEEGPGIAVRPAPLAAGTPAGSPLADESLTTVAAVAAQMRQHLKSDGLHWAKLLEFAKIPNDMPPYVPGSPALRWFNFCELRTEAEGMRRQQPSAGTAGKLAPRKGMRAAGAAGGGPGPSPRSPAARAGALPSGKPRARTVPGKRWSGPASRGRPAPTAAALTSNGAVASGGAGSPATAIGNAAQAAPGAPSLEVRLRQQYAKQPRLLALGERILASPARSLYVRAAAIPDAPVYVVSLPSAAQQQSQRAGSLPIMPASLAEGVAAGTPPADVQLKSLSAVAEQVRPHFPPIRTANLDWVKFLEFAEVPATVPPYAPTLELQWFMQPCGPPGGAGGKRQQPAEGAASDQQLKRPRRAVGASGAAGSAGAAQDAGPGPEPPPAAPGPACGLRTQTGRPAAGAQRQLHGDSPGAPAAPQAVAAHAVCGPPAGSSAGPRTCQQARVSQQQGQPAAGGLQASRTLDPRPLAAAGGSGAAGSASRRDAGGAGTTQLAPIWRADGALCTGNVPLLVPPQPAAHAAAVEGGVQDVHANWFGGSSAGGPALQEATVVPTPPAVQPAEMPPTTTAPTPQPAGPAPAPAAFQTWEPAQSPLGPEHLMSAYPAPGGAPASAGQSTPLGRDALRQALSMAEGAVRAWEAEQQQAHDLRTALAQARDKTEALERQLLQKDELLDDTQRKLQELEALLQQRDWQLAEAREWGKHAR